MGNALQSNLSRSRMDGNMNLTKHGNVKKDTCQDDIKQAKNCNQFQAKITEIHQNKEAYIGASVDYLDL